MTTMELKQSLLQEIAGIMDSDELILKTLEYVRKLKANEVTEEKDSDELIVDSLKAAFTELKAIKSGKGQSRPIEEVLNEL